MNLKFLTEEVPLRIFSGPCQDSSREAPKGTTDQRMRNYRSHR